MRQVGRGRASDVAREHLQNSHPLLCHTSAARARKRARAEPSRAPVRAPVVLTLDVARLRDTGCIKYINRDGASEMETPVRRRAHSLERARRHKRHPIRDISLGAGSQGVLCSTPRRACCAGLTRRARISLRARLSGLCK